MMQIMQISKELTEISRSTPTPEIAEASACVSATRSHLVEATKNIRRSAAQVQVQKEWEEAFIAFVKATEAFSVAVKKDAEARRRAVNL